MSTGTQLQIPDIPVGERAARLVVQFLTRFLPERQQYLFFRSLKMVQYKFKGLDIEALLTSWNSCSSEPPAESGGKISGGAFAITHDIDYSSCLEYVPSLLEMNRGLGITATYNLLTRGGYPLDQQMLKAIVDAGNEVGLHGLHHDRALGCRSLPYIREFIATSKKQLEEKTGKAVEGFRAPALSISNNVMQVLQETGFSYDSSLVNYRLSSRFTASLRPFVAAGSNVVEIPLTVQDSVFVNDFPLSAGQIRNLFERLVEMTLRSGTCLVCNFHPTIIRQDPERYKMIVGLLSGKCSRRCLLREIPLLFKLKL
jgi:peptidoglycan/xylan/chitin deacetylase (PgdA/CDA1 family)